VRGFHGDNEETVAIWKHTREILRNAKLDSEWMIHNAKSLEDVDGMCWE